MSSEFTETVEPGVPDEELRLLAPGTMLAQRYEIDRPLGTGAYAIVYAAYDHALAQRIAVKVLRPDRVTPATLKRLRREVASAREIASSRVVRVFDIGQDGELSFITMELVEGVSLRRELSTGPLALDETLRVAEAILEALALLHSKGLIHRDLKPANILVTNDRRIKLADFGLARHRENDEISATATSAVVGTLDYVSPEQALGKELDPRADLYSFGVLLYEMLTGRLPFGSASSLGAVVANVTTRPPDIRKARSDLPAWLAVLLQRLLEKDPTKRPSSATAVLMTLRRKKIDWGYRWRRSRMYVFTTIAITLVAAAIGAWTWSHHQTRFERISSDTSGTLRALDRGGRMLWSRENLPAHTRSAAVLVREGEPQVIGIPVGEPGSWDSDRESARPFTVWNAQTGAEIGSIAVPAAAPVFPTPPSFSLSGVDAVDVDHDGLQEIVASYVHFPYWPSYTLFIDPRSKESSIIFYASGHHRFLGTIDIDDDGTDEILVGGPNNRMGWRFGLAAIRLRKGDQSSGSGYVPVNTPDTIHFDRAGTASWYALLPRRASSAATIDRIDPATRTFDIVFGDNSRERLSFDGFDLAAKSQLPASLRAKRREAAYQYLRNAGEDEKRDRPHSALAAVTEALQAAKDAREPELVSWVETVHARMLVRLGLSDEEVRRTIDRMLEEGDGGSELCREVANAYSEKGNATAAAEWYIRALELSTDVGHSPVDFLQSAVVSLGEAGDWPGANDLIDTYAARTPGTRNEAETLRAFVLWRTGRPPELPLTTNASFPKFSNYWILELEWANGVADREKFLERTRETLSTTDEAPWMRSLEADILASLGRVDEALPIARMAAESVTNDPTDAFARVHREIVEQRLQKIAQLAAK